jgi:hypothetical protein
VEHPSRRWRTSYKTALTLLDSEMIPGPQEQTSITSYGGPVKTSGAQSCLRPMPM